MARRKSSTPRRPGPSSAFLRVLKRAPNRSLPENAHDAKTNVFISEPLSTFEEEERSCSCDPQPNGDIERIWMECDACHKYQDMACATPNTGILETMTVPLCNGCKVAELHQYFASQRQQFEELAAMLRDKRAEAHDLCGKVLWKHYCNLPKGSSSNAAQDITQTRFVHGAMVPVHSAPEGWIDEVQNHITKMTEDAGEELTESIVGPTNSGQLITEPGHLVYWRELATKLLYGGPYKGNKAELGVLAEVLGLVERGTFWKEDWVEDRSDSATIIEA